MINASTPRTVKSKTFSFALPVGVILAAGVLSSCSDTEFNAGPQTAPAVESKSTEQQKIVIQPVEQKLSVPVIAPSIPQKPTKDCQAHFSGLLMGGVYAEQEISMIYGEDKFSEHVGQGRYPNNQSTFPKSIAKTFDGIAIDAGTKVTVYSEPNFQGKILFEMEGPALVNNVIWIGRYADRINSVFPADLQKNYPLDVRTWSQSDMHAWANGSTVVSCR